MYYYEEDPLPEWTDPIRSAWTLNRSFFIDFINYLEINELESNKAKIELMRLIFSGLSSASVDTESLRDVLMKVETLYPQVLNIAERSALVSSCVLYAKAYLSNVSLQLQNILLTNYSVPENIGEDH